MDNLKIILDACLRVYGADFTVNNRKRENVYARAAFYNVCKANTKETLEEIGKMCGNLDHATVLNGYKKTVKERDGSYLLIPEFRSILYKFETKVNELIELKADLEIESDYIDFINKIDSLGIERKELKDKIDSLETEKQILRNKVFKLKIKEFTKQKELKGKIKALRSERQELKDEVFKLQGDVEELKELESITKDPIQLRITKTLMELPSNILEDFEQYRLNPYLKLQESKVTYKHLN